MECGRWGGVLAGALPPAPLAAPATPAIGAAAATSARSGRSASACRQLGARVAEGEKELSRQLVRGLDHHRRAELVAGGILVRGCLFERRHRMPFGIDGGGAVGAAEQQQGRDRKSTRLNSSHLRIS